MKKTEISYFDWSDIKSDICDEKYFRDYHHLIGGSYKDLWHAQLNYFDSEVRNDLGECIESKLECIKEDGKEWLEPFVITVYKVCEKY